MALPSYSNAPRRVRILGHHNVKVDTACGPMHVQLAGFESHNSGAMRYLFADGATRIQLSDEFPAANSMDILRNGFNWCFSENPAISHEILDALIRAGIAEVVRE